MIDFSKFYDDIEFVAGLYYNNLLSNQDAYDIANKLLEQGYDDILIDISINGEDVDNEDKLGEFLKKTNHDLQFVKDKKRFLIKLLFEYTMAGKIGIVETMSFIEDNVIDRDKTKKFLGDDVGIEEIVGEVDPLLYDEITENTTVKEIESNILQEMSEYIKNN